MKILDIINPDNTGAFNRPIAHALGLEAAIVYSSLIAKQVYYSQREMLDEDGWFYSTVDDLQESTTFKKSVQSKAVKILVENNLLETCRKGNPGRRSFRVLDNVEALEKIIAEGKIVMAALNPIAQKQTSSRSKIEQQVGENSDNKSVEIQPSIIINQKKNKSKVNNPNLSITPVGGIDEDETDILAKTFSADERSDYGEIICDNIAYDSFSESEKEKADELVGIMLDVICSAKKEIRVNGENIPCEVVKSRFLKLNHEHINYVLTALNKNTSEIHNIRAYLITALYNSPNTMENYYSAWVNHDMYGTA